MLWPPSWQCGHLTPPHFLFWFLGSGLGGIMRFLSLPDELLIEILSRLPAQAIASSLSCCRSLHAQSAAVWQASCSRRWPQWAAIAAEPGAQWRRQYELLLLREAEAACLPSVAAIRKVQKSVTERHRSILAEWLCEVSRRGGGGSCMVPPASSLPTSLPPPAGLLRLGSRFYCCLQGRGLPGPLPEHARGGAAHQVMARGNPQTFKHAFRATRSAPALPSS